MRPRGGSRLVPVVPLTVTASIRQRLAAEPGLSDVVSAAAVLGRRFDWALLADITGMPEPEVLDALRAGTRSQLLDSDDRSFRFRHALIRDAVLDSLLPPERGRLAAAAALLARYPELDGAAASWQPRRAIPTSSTTHALLHLPISAGPGLSAGDSAA